MLNRLGLGLLAFLPAASVHSLMLGQVDVPREKIIVYLMIGHSNMCGMDSRRADGVAHPRAWNYLWGTTKTWVPAKETPGRASGGLGGRGSGGPSMPFLKRMAADYPDYYFGVVNNASPSCTCRGENTGASISPLDPEDNRYWKGARLYTEIVTAAKTIQGQATLGGIVLMLGSVEATRTSEAICRAFSADIAQLIQDMRADLNSPQLPFIMGEYEHGATGNFSVAYPLPAVIDQQTKLVSSKVPNSVTIGTQGIDMLDDHHYTATIGQPEFAKRVVAAIQARRWIPVTAGTGIFMLRNGRTFSGAKAYIRLEFLKSQGMEIITQEGNLFFLDGKRHKFKRDHETIHP